MWLDCSLADTSVSLTGYVSMVVLVRVMLVVLVLELDGCNSGGSDDIIVDQGAVGR